MKRYFYLSIGFLVFFLSSVAGADEATVSKDGKEAIPYGMIEPELLTYCYSGGEKLRYDVFYTGGIKIGELRLKVTRESKSKELYEIRFRASTADSFLERIYPIEDLHVTKIFGPQRLPFFYEVWQKEGYDYQAHRMTRYEQEKGEIHYLRDRRPIENFTFNGFIHNEFSAFYASRLMKFVPGTSFIVPTFADKKKVDVVVMVRERELLKETIFNDVQTLVVEPVMTFRGLYDKRGDTVVWYTDDQCRVPVQIKSELMIGSLTARLVAYENNHCPQYSGALLEEYRIEK